MKKKHYQCKFVSLDEAMEDAKKQSVALKKPVAVIQSKRLFYSDSNIEPQRWETLHAVYKDGKKQK
ncbi:MAG: hypothetical protein WD048_03635 [Chitinophagales bacterium]